MRVIRGAPRRGARAAAVALVSATVLARSIPARASDGTDPTSAEAGEQKGPKKSKKKKRGSPEGGAVAVENRLGRVEIGGRIFARAAFSHQPRIIVDETGTPVERDVDSFDTRVPSARLRAKYRAPVKWLSAEVEADFAGRPELKDAYVRARPDHALVQAGQFKMPFSAFRLASPWELPLADRGFVDDVLTDRFQIAGRRPGWALGMRAKGSVRPELVVGSFQGSVLEDVTQGDFEPIDELTLDSQSAVARATIRVGDVSLGAAYEHRVGSPAELEVEHYATGNLDAVVDSEIGRGGLRVWVEAVAGQSFFEHEVKPQDGADAIFFSARLITAYRFGGRRHGELYVEPYGMIATVDPDLEIAADAALEEVLGLNVGLWELARVGLQAEIVRVGRNFPRAVYLGQLLDRTALVLQAGLEF